jgi:GT2 family glycosyltransferase
LPKISIITAAYNHVNFVRQSVDSALAQTYRDFEHIIVDDGSTDGTADVLKSFGDKIRYIRQENRGAHAAINVGIRASSGEYVAILDSDDVWLPNKLERQMKVFERNPEAGLVYSLAYAIDSEGRLVEAEKIVGEPLTCPNHAFEELALKSPIPALTAIFRRRSVDEVGLFDESLKAVADWELWLRIADKWPVFCIPEPLALYRIHSNNTTHLLRRTGRIFEEMLLALEKASPSFSRRAREMPRLKEIATAGIQSYWAQAYVKDGDLDSSIQKIVECAKLDLGTAAKGARSVTMQIETQYGQTRALEFVDEVCSAVAQCLICDSWKREFRGNWHATHALVFHRSGDSASAVRASLNAILANPSLLKNRDLVYVFLYSSLGPGVAEFLRRMVPRRRIQPH